ncbi:MAG: hypothetical protein EA359_17720, partial [Balneolaceae bacterium]
MGSDKLHTAKQFSEQLLEYPETDWDDLINKWCAGDEELQTELQRLADLNRNARIFVEEFQKRVYKLTKSSLDSGVHKPSEIGGYKQIRRLGSGGSATVYLVQNESGQKGALKVLRGMSADEHSHQRFEAERHILATLSHPNIARLIEGGITASGEPFVIMEYVNGIPVDEWCNQKGLGIPERIQLFRKICRAVHYAHQNLVVHRDIKPEHVLIDANGEVKLIDFGIAKLLQPDNPELASIHTRTGMRVMTPDFASPEQVRGEHITTASDVYSLGVLLYLLLTGQRPYKVSTTSMLEIERIVCELDPPKPSEVVFRSEVPVSDQTTKQPFTPDQSNRLRGMEPARLARQLSGDLDRIVMMAMWKEPQRRYSSALALSDDLGNYLAGEPVTARAPTLRYRVRKFVYRHKMAVAAATFAVLALTGGLIGTLWQARQAQLHAEKAEIQAQRAEQVAAFLVELFEESDPTKANDGSKTAREMLDQGYEKVQTELDGQPAVQAQMLGIIGKVYQNLGLYDQAFSALEKAVEGYRDTGDSSPRYVSALLELANLEYRMGLLDQAENSTLVALELNIEYYGPDHPEVASVLNTLAIIYEGKGELENAKNTIRRVLDIRRQEPEPGSNLAANLNNLAIMLHRSGELDESAELFEEAIDVVNNIWGEIHPYMAFTLNGYSGVHQLRGDYEQAEKYMRRALEIGQTVFPEKHPFNAVVLHNLGKLFEETGDLPEAENFFRKGLNLRRGSLPPNHPDLASSLEGLAVILIETGRAADAEPMLREALEILMNSFDEDHWRIANAEANLGRSLLHQHRFDEAENLLQKSYTSLLASRGDDDIHTKRVEKDLETLSS